MLYHDLSLVTVPYSGTWTEYESVLSFYMCSMPLPSYADIGTVKYIDPFDLNTGTIMIKQGLPSSLV